MRYQIVETENVGVLHSTAKLLYFIWDAQTASWIEGYTPSKDVAERWADKLNK